MRFIFLALFGVAAVVGCGSDGVGPGDGTGGAASVDTNEYPLGAEMSDCFGDCPKGECQYFQLHGKPQCSELYPSPLDERSTYCGSAKGSYCLRANQDYYAVQCEGGKAAIQHCSSHACSNGSGTFECL